MNEIGIGLVGYGAIGRLHALCYQMLALAYPELPPVRIAAVQTATPESAARARRELGDILATTRLEELLASPAVHVVDCCAPTGDHARVARWRRKEALRATRERRPDLLRGRQLSAEDQALLMEIEEDRGTRT